MPTTKCGFDDDGGVPGSDLLIAVGPTLHVNIGFDPNYRPDTGAAPNIPPDFIQALVDTGATTSCIDTRLAAALNLPVVDRQTIAGAHGSAEVNIHLAQIIIPSLLCTISGGFAGVDLAAGGQPHMALIGRTFLQEFRMTYDGRSGTVILSND